MSLLWLVLLPLSPSLPGLMVSMLADPSPSSPLALTKGGGGVWQEGKGEWGGGADSPRADHTLSLLTHPPALAIPSRNSPASHAVSS